ncbi:MAG: PilN domain-containing protein [Candidatus Omnitrophota bacterium]
MIEINLLPEELRNRLVKADNPEVAESSGSLEPKHFILLVPLIFGILVCVQLTIGVWGISRAQRLHALKQEWKTLESERKALRESSEKYALASEGPRALQQMLRDRIIWSEKLNRLSLDLPPGIWFEGLAVNSNELTLLAAGVSLKKEDMALIKQFIDNLKNDPAFIKDFNGLELGQAVKKTIGSYEITEFTLEAAINRASAKTK